MLHPSQWLQAGVTYYKQSLRQPYLQSSQGWTHIWIESGSTQPLQFALWNRHFRISWTATEPPDLGGVKK